jgi:hypothetical protein
LTFLLFAFLVVKHCYASWFDQIKEGVMCRSYYQAAANVYFAQFYGPQNLGRKNRVCENERATLI